MPVRLGEARRAEEAVNIYVQIDMGEESCNDGRRAVLCHVVPAIQYIDGALTAYEFWCLAAICISYAASDNKSLLSWECTSRKMYAAWVRELAPVVSKGALTALAATVTHR